MMRNLMARSLVLLLATSSTVLAANPSRSLIVPLSSAEAPVASAGALTLTPERRHILDLKESEERTISDKAFPFLPAKLNSDVVAVCWENALPANLQERNWVRDALAKSWQRVSVLRFTGWGNCLPTHRGVRIQIADSGPHVKKLGKFMLGLEHGMVLNFSFQNWGQVCAATPADREFCIRAIAVHEFGHAIGFAHEQNRPDTPGDCLDPPQGGNGNVLLTPWDPNSVMNYCNKVYGGGGNLSEFDIYAVQVMYGAP
jgi:Astacin (Peptidase family M12A)